MNTITVQMLLWYIKEGEDPKFRSGLHLWDINLDGPALEQDGSLSEELVHRIDIRVGAAQNHYTDREIRMSQLLQVYWVSDAFPYEHTIVYKSEVYHELFKAGI